jgi:hypothetical protein
VVYVCVVILESEFFLVVELDTFFVHVENQNHTSLFIFFFSSFLLLSEHCPFFALEGFVLDSCG